MYQIKERLIEKKYLDNLQKNTNIGRKIIEASKRRRWWEKSEWKKNIRKEKSASKKSEAKKETHTQAFVFVGVAHGAEDKREHKREPCGVHIIHKLRSKEEQNKY